jgi:hypothetical protein
MSKKSSKSTKKTVTSPGPRGAKASGKISPKDEASASSRIDRRIDELGDWRGKTLEQVRRLIRKTDSEIVEEWKWGTPVWSHHGIICTGETYQDKVKLTFAQGASLPDPSRLFNSSLDGKVRRAIDFKQTDKLNELALNDLLRAAVEHNVKYIKERRGRA